jgi:phospholipase/lecithinase/hemolysin
MATASPAGIIVVLLVLAAFSVAAAAAAKVPAMYVFGDSTADVGSNNYLPGTAVPRANFPHNGVDFPTSRPTGRFSNGYNGVDFLGKRPLLCFLLFCVSRDLLASAYTSMD